jgi:hypothetical protein
MSVAARQRKPEKNNPPFERRVERALPAATGIGEPALPRQKETVPMTTLEAEVERRKHGYMLRKQALVSLKHRPREWEKAFQASDFRDWIRAVRAGERELARRA